MEAYIYNADIYCEDCGREIRRDIKAAAKLAGEAIDRDDSDSWPQGPYPDGGGEADCPQHCGGCSVFLENPLTTEGRDYVKELLIEHRDSGRGSADVLACWSNFYDIHLEEEEEEEAE